MNGPDRRYAEAAPAPAAATGFCLQPADPFDLIRSLARPQSDPRKAVDVLVQNSIDAGARTMVVERRRVRGAPALIVRDDGEGVLPDRGARRRFATRAAPGAAWRGKEIVARTYAQPGTSELLEHLVAVVAHAERNLRSS